MSALRTIIISLPSDAPPIDPYVQMYADGYGLILTHGGVTGEDIIIRRVERLPRPVRGILNFISRSKS
jgi:hypothetical protein